jgi:arylformamidase
MDLYRNRDFIPNFDCLLAETAARSRELAARSEVRLDIAYGTSPRERLDILIPPHVVKGAPLHMFIHGGYWRSGSKADHHLVAAPVLAVGGIAAIISYDLMPRTRLSAIVEQVRSAARHVQSMAPDLGADADRFTVSGHSAGAHLASYLAAHGPGEVSRSELPATRGILMVSGIYDLTGIPNSFLQHETGMTEAEAQSWSPLNSVQFAGPKRILSRGALETAPFHEQAAKYAALLRNKRLDVELYEEPQINHLSIVLSLGDPNSRLGRILSELTQS